MEEVRTLPQEATVAMDAKATQQATAPALAMDGYNAPLIARTHMRLGIWRWTNTHADVML